MTTKGGIPSASTMLPVVHLERPVYDQEAFGLRYRQISKSSITFGEKYSNFRKSLSSKKPSTKSLLGGIKGAARKVLPFIQIMRHYQWKEWIVGDIISGISVGAIHIPQCMGYAKLSEVPPPYGLYSTFFPLLVYFFIGTSRHLSIGTVALVSLLVGSTVRKHLPAFLAAERASASMLDGGTTLGTTGIAESTFQQTTLTYIANATMAGVKAVDGWPEDETMVRIELAATLAMIVGIIQFLLGFCRLGLIATFMSTPFNSAFMTGSAFHTAMSQLPPALGYKIKPTSGMGTVPLSFIELCKNIEKTNPADIIAFLITMAILIFIKEFINVKFQKKLPVPLPADLIVLVLGIIIAYAGNLHNTYNLKVLKDVQGGMPAPKLPRYIGKISSDFIIDGFVVSIIGFVVCVSMAKIYARKYKYSIDSNQELIAYGSMNFVSSFFSCFPSAQAPPRTLVHEAAGGKSQVSGIVSAILILLVCLFLGPLFYTLPNAVLAAIIIVALFPLFKQFREIRVYWNLNKFDCAVWVVTCFSTALTDLPYGILIGVAWNLLTMCAQSFVVRGYSMSAANDCDVFVPSGVYSRTAEIEGIKIFRYESDLFFANVENFKSQLFKNTVDPQKATLIKDRLAKAEGSSLPPTLPMTVKSVPSATDEKNGISNDAKGRRRLSVAVGDKEVLVSVVSNEYSNINDNGLISEGGDAKTQPEDKAEHMRDHFFQRPSTDVASPLSAFYQRPTINSIAMDADDSDLEEEVRTQAYMRRVSVHSIVLDTHTIILDCGAIGYIDFNGLLTIRQLFEDYRDAGIRFLLASCGKFMIAKLKKSGIYDEFGCFVFPTLFDAVMATKLEGAFSADI